MGMDPNNLFGSGDAYFLKTEVGSGFVTSVSLQFSLISDFIGFGYNVCR